MSSSVRSAVAAAGSNPVLETGARLGYAASGLLHVLMAWVTLQLGWGSTTGDASQAGALRTLSGSGIGSVLLWSTVVGFVLLALWQVSEAVVRHDRTERLRAVARGALYLVLAWTAYSVVRGPAAGGSTQEPALVAMLVGTPWGRLLLGASGIAVAAVGVHHVVKGWRARFLRDLRERPGPWLVRAGRVGYVAKGVALVLVGGLLVAAAATAGPDRPQGFDGAVRTLLQLPLGKALLTLVALGIAAYGVYSFGRSRYARV